ncbi:MAG TPA: aspartate kinase, partial [Candidatus Omnitrophica bacterium]|nr:aspartate kinase [Candidatus Omnitrophota bacterium]
MSKRIIVQKYGGTSVESPERIRRVARRIVTTYKKGVNLVVVVSALGKTTDELIRLAYKMTDEPSERELDMLISTGEQISAALLTMAIHKEGYDAISLTGHQVGIITDSTHAKARIVDIDTRRVKKELRKGKIVIVAGFQGRSRKNEITTLGRGGSDLTAVALAKALRADICEIYTDVEGIYTADPRIVKEARKLKEISYDEILELTSMGSQVLQSRSVEVAKKYNVPVYVCSSFSKREGTMIIKEVKKMEGVLVSGITLDKNEAKVTICDVPDRPGIAAKIFKEIAEENINVDVIVQNISHTGVTDISFTVNKTDLDRTIKVVKKITPKVKAGSVIYDKDIAKISVVGVGMRSYPGVAAKMFGALGKNKINIEMISTSEIKISCVIEKDRAEEAVRI